MDERTTLLVRTHLDSVNLVDEYQKLQAENERLKARNKYLENFRNEEKEIFTPSKIKIIKDLKKENAKLKCLALLLASEMYWFKSLCNKDEGSDWWAKMKRQSVYYRKAYRKAKKALMEGK